MTTGLIEVALVTLKQSATSPALRWEYGHTLKRWTPVTVGDVTALVERVTALRSTGQCTASELNALRRYAASL